MHANPTDPEGPEPRQSLAALWQEATDIVRDAITEAEAAIDFIGTTLESLRPLLERVRALEAQIQEAPATFGTRAPQPGEAQPSTPTPEQGGGAPPGEPPQVPSTAKEAIARYTLTLETGETRPDFPSLYRRLDETLGNAEMALISYLGGMAVLTVEGPDLAPEALERGIREGLGAGVDLEWEDEQHLRVRLD